MPPGHPIDAQRSTDLVVVVVQVGVSTLQLHHLDLRHPLLLSLGHEVAVWVSVPPVPSDPSPVTGETERTSVTSHTDRDTPAFVHMLSNISITLFNHMKPTVPSSEVTISKCPIDLQGLNELQHVVRL